MREGMRRWTGFAQAMRARHARIARRHLPSSMTLARPRAARVVSHAFHSHPSVSVHVRMPGQTSPSAPAIPPTVPQPGVIRESSRQTIRREVVYRERMRLASAPHDSKMSRVDVKRIERADPPAPATPQALTAPPPRWEARMLRPAMAQDVLQRTRRVEETVRHLRLATVAARNAADAARRVVRQASRTEERPAPAPMQLRVAATVAPAIRGEAPEEHMPRHAQPAAAPPAVAAAPAINIDTLTTQVMDQIDRRVVAWRERMGKF